MDKLTIAESIPLKAPYIDSHAKVRLIHCKGFTPITWVASGMPLNEFIQQFVRRF
jgi:hypothetical protein